MRSRAAHHALLWAVAGLIRGDAGGDPGHVAFHMSEWRTFVSEFRAPKSDVAVLLTTFLLTVLVDLTVAIEVGMVLAAFLFMRRMAEVTNISVLTHEFTDPADDFEHDPTPYGGA